MPNVEQVTVTIPADLLADMDLHATDRSAFVAEAVRNELLRRRRAGLHLSLESPNPECTAVSEDGFEEWARSLPDEDVDALIDWSKARRIQWVPNQGWVEEQG